MQNPWQRIETWFETHAPEVLTGLNPPATEQDITAAEAVLGVRFPDEFRALYLVHDGQSPDAPWMMLGWEWLPLKSICGESKVWNDLLAGHSFDGAENDSDGTIVRKDWWHPHWIPFTYSGGGDHHCLDLAPGPEGAVGQVMVMWHDDGQRPVLASSFDAFLASYAAQLEAGEYVYSSEDKVLLRKDEM